MRHIFILFLLSLIFEFCHSWVKIPDFVEGFVNIERCNDYWITNSIKGLRKDINDKVFGQPFLENALIHLLKSHLLEWNSPSKALAISFHGSPGTGKTYVSQLIADNIYKKGRGSKFYKHYTMADVYYLAQSNKKLIDDIKEKVTKCPRTLFVFDEIEKMPDGTFDSIKSFLDYYSTVDNIDFRLSTFIFISNIGMEKINSLSRKLFIEGLKREEYKLSLFEHELSDILFKADGGLKGTSVVKNYLIDLYLPFLPLEEKHIKQCIRATGFHIPEDKLKLVIDELVFVPENAPIYSMTGCKSIRSLLRKSYSENKHDEL